VRKRKAVTKPTFLYSKVSVSGTNIKLTLYKALIYTCPTREYAADPQLLKLQRLQNRVLRAIGDIHRCTPVRELHTAFGIAYVYGYIIINYAEHRQK
jgi:hypothetical protein